MLKAIHCVIYVFMSGFYVAPLMGLEKELVIFALSGFYFALGVLALLE